MERPLPAERPPLVKTTVLGASAIVLAGSCTVEDPRLFSYRRDGVTGRQGMAVVVSAGDDQGGQNGRRD